MAARAWYSGSPVAPGLASQGSIDWVKTFHAAKSGGVTSYFVEQSWALTRQSVAYLKTLRA